jgi:hypothetical protein
MMPAYKTEKRTRVIVLTALLGLACPVTQAACGEAIDVHTKTSPTAEFSRYQTLAIGAPERVPTRYHEAPRATRAEQRAQELVTDILQSKGYRLAPNADLVVRIAAGVRHREVPIPLAAPLPGSPPTDPWFIEDEAGEILEGALVVAVYDGATGALLSHGAARAFIDPERFDDERLRRGLAKVMSQFPERH